MKTNVYFIAMFDDLVIYDNLDSSCMLLPVIDIT